MAGGTYVVRVGFGGGGIRDVWTGRLEGDEGLVACLGLGFAEALQHRGPEIAGIFDRV